MNIKKYNAVLNNKLVSWNNTTIYIALLSDNYVFDVAHSMLDIVHYETFKQKLEVSQTTHNTSIIFDADDIYQEKTTFEYSTYLLIYDIQKGPLFLFENVCGLPVDLTGGILKITFSDNYHKIFSYDILSQEPYTFGTPNISVTKVEQIQDTTASDLYQSRSGIPIAFVEEVDKSTLTGKNSLYKDLSVTGKPHPLTGDLGVLTGASAINQSLKNLLLTGIYDRPYSSQQLGANIKKYLFEFADNITKDSISKDVLTAIQNYEPRILVLGIKVNILPEQYSIAISIAYKIKTTNIEGSTTVFLKRA